MAYPESFLRLVVLGTLYGNEIFSWSLALRRSEFNLPVPDEVPQGVIDAVTTFHTTANIGTSSQSHLTGIKLNLIGTDGRYASDGETVLHEFVPPVAGAGTPGMPSQCALAVTLGTAATRGRASRGRFYLPRLAGSPQADGRLTPSNVENVAEAASLFIENLHAALPGYRVAVTSNIGQGTIREVTHVEVGRVIDTIRTRRNSLDEDRFVGEPLLP